MACRDLLQRHYTVHGRNQNNEEGLPPQGIIPKSAGRTPIACSNCAKTKTKCDKKFPCSRCEQRNLKCTLRPTRRASKNINRINVPVERSGSGSSSENGGNTETQSVSRNNTPPQEGQVQQDAAKSSPPQQLQQNQPLQLIQNGQSPSQRHSQSPSVSHSRNSSESHAVQLTQNSTPEGKSLHMALSSAPAFFDHSPSSSLSQAPPSMLSPLPTPVHSTNAFMSSTPMSSYDEFVRTVRDHSESSPPFLMDPWSAMPMNTEFDPMRIDPSLMMSINMDMNMGSHTDSILGIIPEMSPPQSYGPVQTPLQTPRMDEPFSELQIGSSASMFFPSNRHSSIADTGIPDLSAIIAAQDGWTVFRCSPSIPSSSCPRTARLNLERLELSLKNHEGWSNWSPSWDEADIQQRGQITVARLQECTRDKLLAITQSFLHKALDIHKDGQSTSSSSGESPESSASGSNFVLLPPARVLEHFLKSYANSFERYFPTSSRGILDANELMQNYNEKASSLLILMMIAQGAMSIPSIEARWLTGGFTEACRISLFDLIEKNIIMAGDPIVLRAALLFTVQAAWSGDKWQMDIAMGQRGMYFSMLRHSGILESRPGSVSRMSGSSTTDLLWRDWLQQESRSR